MPESQQLCELCGKNPVHHVHHKNLNHKDNTKENLQGLCTFCHSELHGISPKKSELKELVVVRDRALKIRNAMDNQIRGFGRIELVVPEHWPADRKVWNKIIKEQEKKIKTIMKNGDFKAWIWLQQIKGIGEVSAAKIISYVDIAKTPSISALWRYCGLDATHIKRKKKCSAAEAKMFGNPYLKKEMMGILADSFIKQRTPVYRGIYDNEKARQAAMVGEAAPKNKMHAHLRAKRKMIKIFLSNLWCEWRMLEDLSVSEPYVQAHLKHENIICVPVKIVRGE